LVTGLDAPVILVGHLPHLSRLTGLLVAGDPKREIVSFRMGALIALTRAENGPWQIRWILPPELGVRVEDNLGARATDGAGDTRAV
jgi:phosphohistidine phosphatase